jgi:hypothetical protein
MYTKLWIPGTDNELDDLFDMHRQIHHDDHSHRLYDNYAREAFAEVSALSITFENDEPAMFGSILNRSCWPDNAYRICNRTWKAKEYRLVTGSMHGPSLVFGEMITSHVEYVKQNLNWELIFISRQTDNWQRVAKTTFNRQLGLEFEYDKYKYLTCENDCDDSCWQYVLYMGNASLLENWKRKLT